MTRRMSNKLLGHDQDTIRTLFWDTLRTLFWDTVRTVLGHYEGNERHLLSGPVSRDIARLSQRYPPIARYGVFVSQHGQLGAIPPPPFLSVSPLESMRSRGARQNACDTPLCDTTSKRYCAIWGVSRTGPLRERSCIGVHPRLPKTKK